MNSKENLMQELLEFHFDTECSDTERMNLYLTGISALAIQHMENMGASDFEIRTELEPKTVNRKYKATFKIEEQ